MNNESHQLSADDGPRDATGQHVRRILYVEPNAADVELTANHFATTAPHLQLHGVPSCADALALLAPGHPFDLVLTGLRVPGMNAQAFIREAQHRGVDLPFIIISGQSDEATAVGLLHLGVYDYIVKRENYLTQLPHTIDRALHRFHLEQKTCSLQAELELLNASLVQNGEERTAELSREMEKWRLSESLTEHKRAETALRESEDRYRDLVEHSNDLICTHDLDGRILSVNEGAVRLTGYPREALLRMNIADLVDPEARNGFGEYLMTIRDNGRARGSMRIRTAAGEVRYWEYDNTMRVEGGAAPVVRGIARDITERKRAEDALRTSQEQLLSLIEQAPVSIAMFDRELRYLVASQRWVADYGRGLSNVVGRSHYEILPDLPERWKEVHRRGLAGETLRNDDDLWVQADGTRNWLRWAVLPWRNARGEIGGIIISTEDITERKRVEEALRENEEKFARAFHSNPAMIILTTLDGKNVDFNESYAKFLGRSREEILGKSVADLQVISAEERQKIVDLIQRAGGSLHSVEVPMRGPGGSLLHVLLSADTVSLGGVPHRLTTLLDITERKRIEEALHASEARTRLLIESSNIGLWDWNLVTNEVFFSPEWKQQLGYADHELPNRYEEWANRMHPDDREPTLGAVRDYRERRRADRDVQFRLRHKDGSWRWILTRADLIRDADGKPARMMGCHIDITEQRRAEDERRQIFERITDAFVALDTNWCYTFVNGKAAQMFGRSPEDLIGKHIWTEFIEGVGQKFQLAHEKAMSDQQPAFFEEYYPHSGRWFENRIYPSPEGLTIYFHDITERKEAEEKINRQVKELRQWYQTTLGREDRVRQLKQEVNDLLQRLGEPPLYRSQEARPGVPPGGSKR